jgi:hypothetical protein
MADGSKFRDEILRKYDFTPQAREILRNVPITIDDLKRPLGGGGWYPVEQRIHLNGVQDEACVHELTHAWADLTQFYVDPHPHNPSLKGQHFAFRRDVERAATETDPAFLRVAFLAWEYTYGNPNTGFPGMNELDWERFAGLSSGVMGDIRLMPPDVRRWYEDMFGGNPEVAGPSELPPWAPPGWRQGDVPRQAPMTAPAATRNESWLDRLRRALFGR